LLANRRLSYTPTALGEGSKVQEERPRQILKAAVRAFARNGVAYGATIWYGALEEILTGWAFGQLPDGDDDVSRAEHAVVEIVAGGLAEDRAVAPA
jgi:hypothetical protein